MSVTTGKRIFLAFAPDDAEQVAVLKAAVMKAGHDTYDFDDLLETPTRDPVTVEDLIDSDMLFVLWSKYAESDSSVLQKLALFSRRRPNGEIIIFTLGATYLVPWEIKAFPNSRCIHASEGALTAANYIYNGVFRNDVRRRFAGSKSTVAWNWKRTTVAPEDILDAAGTLKQSSVYEYNLIPDWSKSSLYLDWAKEAFAEQTPRGFDGAMCYAKRATCRQIDGLMVQNHLRCFLGHNYPAKLEMLKHVGIAIPDVVHTLIIDPRNEVEHEYRSVTKKSAQDAVGVTELFLKATESDAQLGSLFVLGSLPLAYSTPPGSSRKIEIIVNHNTLPFLLVDIWKAAENVLIVRPEASEIRECPFKKFSRDATQSLAKKLRDAEPDRARCVTWDRETVDALQSQLAL